LSNRTALELYASLLSPFPKALRSGIPPLGGFAAARTAANFVVGMAWVDPPRCR
jgi:hypothetical protein